jgi:hypothetical protein
MEITFDLLNFSRVEPLLPIVGQGGKLTNLHTLFSSHRSVRRSLERSLSSRKKAVVVQDSDSVTILLKDTIFVLAI